MEGGGIVNEEAVINILGLIENQLVFGGERVN